MKRKSIVLSLILIIVLIASFSFVACKKPVTESYEVKTVRSWVDSMRDNINKKGVKGYETSFWQSYTFSYTRDDEYETVEYAQTYEASGSAMFSYTLGDTANTTDVDYEKIFTDGTGYFTGSQSEKSVMNYHVFSKYLLENQERTMNYDYDFTHDFALLFDNESISTYAKNKVTDNINSENDMDNVFKGMIKKDVFGDLSTQFMGSFSKEILYLDAWSYISEFSTLINEFYENVKFASAKEVESFIEKFDVKITETDDTIKVDYLIDTNYVISTETGEKTNFPPIVGTATMEKSTGDVIYYMYDFTDCFTAIMNMPEDEEDGEYTVTVGEFIVEGRILNSELSPLNIEGDFNEYTEETVNEFLENFDKYVSFSPDIFKIEE